MIQIHVLEAIELVPVTISAIGVVTSVFSVGLQLLEQFPLPNIISICNCNISVTQGIHVDDKTRLPLHGSLGVTFRHLGLVLSGVVSQSCIK